MSPTNDMVEKKQTSIWLEVANVRVGEGVQIQIKGDRTDPEPEWWTLSEGAVVSEQGDNAAYRAITDGLDKKRIVLANLGIDGDQLKCMHVRVQYAESTSR